jgi:hypothetical protein
MVCCSNCNNFHGLQDGNSSQAGPPHVKAAPAQAVLAPTEAVAETGGGPQFARHQSLGLHRRHVLSASGALAEHVSGGDPSAPSISPCLACTAQGCQAIAQACAVLPALLLNHPPAQSTDACRPLRLPAIPHAVIHPVVP